MGILRVISECHGKKNIHATFIGLQSHTNIYYPEQLEPKRITMCIIIYKPRGVELPQERYLYNSFSNNPDGCGFMYPEGNGVRIKRGFMDYESFKHEIFQIPNVKDIDVVIHFRWATHGSVVPKNTQPIPITTSYSEIEKTDTFSEFGFTHNGVMGWLQGTPEDMKHDISDSIIFGRLIAELREVDIKLIYKLLKTFGRGQRYALMNTYETRLYGDYHEHEGCFYSQKSYSYESHKFEFDTKSLDWYDKTKTISKLWGPGAYSKHKKGKSKNNKTDFECESFILIDLKTSTIPMIENELEILYDTLDYYEQYKAGDQHNIAQLHHDISECVEELDYRSPKKKKWYK